MAPLDGGVAREESVIDTWELGANLTENTTIVFGPVGAVSPTGMRHLCWIDDQGHVHHGRLGEDNRWTDSTSATWSTRTTVDNASARSAPLWPPPMTAKSRHQGRRKPHGGTRSLPHPMYLNQVWHVRTFMLDVDASSISLVLHEDREHAGVVDANGSFGWCGTARSGTAP